MHDVVAMVFYVSLVVFWMIVGWRLARAHERLADGVAILARDGLRRSEEA